MTKINKKIVGIILYVLLFVGGVSLTEFPESHSYFKTTNHEAVEFNAKVTKAYHEVELELNTDSGAPKLTTSAPFIFSIDINKGVSVTKDDKYTVNVPDSCNVTRISDGKGTYSSSNSITLGGNSEENSFTYRDGSLTVNMTCDIVILEDIKIPDFTVSESIANGNQVTYAKVTHKGMSYSEYRNYITSSVVSTLGPIKGSDSEVYDEFKVWLKDYIALFYSDYNEDGTLLSNPVMQYILSDNNNDENYTGKLSTLEKFTAALPTTAGGKYTLPGISITRDADGSYTFSIEDNLLGYARTYLSVRSIDTYAFYFDTTNKITSTPDKDIVNKAFNYYLENYIYPGDQTTSDRVKDYVNNQLPNGIYDLPISSEIIIPDIIKIGDTYYIDKSTTKEFANLKYPLQFEYGDVDETLEKIKRVISLNPMKETCVSEILKGVVNDPVGNRLFFEELVKGSTNVSAEQRKKYEDLGITIYSTNNQPSLNYFIEYSKTTGQYVLFTLWSDGITGLRMKFQTFDAPEGYKIDEYNVSWENPKTPNALQILFTYTSRIDDGTLEAFKTQFKALVGVNDYISEAGNADRTMYYIVMDVNDLINKLNSETVYDLLSSKDSIEHVPFPAVKQLSISDAESVTDANNENFETESTLETDVSVENVENTVPGIKDDPDYGKEESSESSESSESIQSTNEESLLEESTIEIESTEEVKTSDTPKESTEEKVLESTEMNAEESTSLEEKISNKEEDTNDYSTEVKVSDKPKEMEVEETPVDKIPPIK